MGIQTVNSSDVPKRPMRIVSYPPGVYVRFLGQPADNLVLWLHMKGGHSYPCLGEECTDCRDDRFPFGYAPVQVGSWSGVSFTGDHLGILPITPYALDLAFAPCKGKVCFVTRFPLNKRGQTVFNFGYEEERPRKLPPCFAVLPHMQNLWAWFAKKDRAAELRVAPLTEDDALRFAGKAG
jgi:hypothetical protein